MRTTSPRIFAKATAAAAALSVLLFAATGPTPSWPDCSEYIVTSDFKTESFGAPDRHATILGTSTVWVGTIATPSLITNASYNCTTLDNVQECAVGCRGGFTMAPYFPTADVRDTTRNTDGRTTTTTTSASRSDPSLAEKSPTIYFHNRFDGAAHADTRNKSRWRRFRQEPLRLPDQFMARFLNTLMYPAEVITVDVISAFLFGRWRPRYYQRAKKNRLDRARRRRYRRFMMFAADVAMMIWDACVWLHDTLCPIIDDVPTPIYEMVSNVPLAEDPATPSTVADVATSEVAATVASASCSALVSISFSPSPNSAIPGLPLHKSNTTQLIATTVEQRPAVSTPVPRLLGAPEMSKEASCHPRASLPDTELDIALLSAVSHSSPLPLEAAPPTAAPSLFPTIGVPADGHKELTLRAPRLSASLLPSSTAASSGCAVGMVNSLMICTTSERSVTTPVEELGGSANHANDTPLAPFLVSERYTPESTCYIGEHGVAYTTIIMSYVHQVNLATSRGLEDDTPTTTQTGDVSDILLPASNSGIGHTPENILIHSKLPSTCKEVRTRCGSPPHEGLLVGCSSPFVRLAQHITALRARCTRCLPGRGKPLRFPYPRCRDARVYCVLTMSMQEMRPPSTMNDPCSICTVHVIFGIGCKYTWRPNKAPTYAFR